jgi:hypothetical protein
MSPVCSSQEASFHPGTNVDFPIGPRRKHPPGLPWNPIDSAHGTQEQDRTPSNLSKTMDPRFSAVGIFANHVGTTATGHDLKHTVLGTESRKPTSVALRSLSRVPGTGHLVFNSSMEAMVQRKLGPRSRADKDAAVRLKRAGGACRRHKASKKKVRQTI